jgi:hypothetical protein
MDFGEAFQQTTPDGAHEYRNVIRKTMRREIMKLFHGEQVLIKENNLLQPQIHTPLGII